MKLDEKEEQFLFRVKKSAMSPLWPTITCLASAAFITFSHKDKFCLEGLITIETLILLLFFIAVLKKRSERKLINIVNKLTKPLRSPLYQRSTPLTTKPNFRERS